MPSPAALDLVTDAITESEHIHAMLNERFMEDLYGREASWQEDRDEAESMRREDERR